MSKRKRKEAEKSADMMANEVLEECGKEVADIADQEAISSLSGLAYSEKMTDGTSMDTDIGQLAQSRELDQDERALIRTQERLAKEKKQKKSHKRRLIALSSVAVIAIAAVWYVFWGHDLLFPTAASTIVEVVAEEGQEIIYASLTAIRGNEIEYVVTGEEGEEVEEEEVTYTTLIPVGTDVITRLGVTTTFSRLAAGDSIALIMEECDGEDVIVKVYIVG